MSNISLFYSSKASSRPSTILKSLKSYGLFGKKESHSSKVRVENGKEWGTNDFTRAVSGSTFHCLSWMSVVKKRDGGLFFFSSGNFSMKLWLFIICYLPFLWPDNFSKLFFKSTQAICWKLCNTKIRCWLTFKKKFTLVNNATTRSRATTISCKSGSVHFCALLLWPSYFSHKNHTKEAKFFTNCGDSFDRFWGDGEEKKNSSFFFIADHHLSIRIPCIS